MRFIIRMGDEEFWPEIAAPWGVLGWAQESWSGFATRRKRRWGATKMVHGCGHGMTASVLCPHDGPGGLDPSVCSSKFPRARCVPAQRQLPKAS